MKITMPFLVLFLTAIFLFLAATNIQGGWLYALDALLWSAITVALGLPLLQFKQLNFVRHLPDCSLADQPLKVVLRILNPWRWPLILLHFSEQRITSWRSGQTLKPENSNGFALILKHNQSTEITYTVTPNISGLLYWEGMRISTFGPLGLVGFYHFQPRPDSLIIYPNKPDTTGSPLRQHLFDSVRQSKKNTAATHEISHFRDYQPGDSRREIHWKNTARQQRLIVKETHEEHSSQALIIFNTHQDQPRQIFYDMVKTAEEICSSLIDAQIEVSGWAQKAETDFWEKHQLPLPKRQCQNARAWLQVCNWLATLEPDAKDTFDQFLSTRLQSLPSGLIIFISQTPPAPELLQTLLENMSGQTLLFYGAQPETMSQTWGTHIEWHPLSNFPLTLSKQ
jgi:hypothetical protein